MLVKRNVVRMDMKHSTTNLMDLPDEIIVIILKKLDNVQVLYSFMNINARFNRILRDSVFTNQINLITTNDLSLIQPERLFHRFFLEILPKIDDQIIRFGVESASLERILLAGTYPNLHHLDIFLTEEVELHLTNESSLIDIFANQITTLSITGRNSVYDSKTLNARADFLSNILMMFKNVHYFQFYQNLGYFLPSVSFPNQSSLFSSTLQELHINVYYFDDCIHLLNGRLNQLCTLFINVIHIIPLRSFIDNKEKMVKLKLFSLTCRNETFVYNEILLPHLRQMFNLEKLILNISIEGQGKFLDGNDLKKEIINHLPRLRQFAFNIRSIVQFDHLLNVPSKENIQSTLTNCCSDNEIISYVDYFPSERKGQCHIYTYPHEMIFYDGISNHFPGGTFKYVRQAMLFDERPFNHTFFLRISRAFPFLKDLTVKNFQAQDHNQNPSIIEYPSLIHLCLVDIHDDYAEQFLLDERTSLSNQIRLLIEYDTLQRITQDFTRDATRINCGQMKKVNMINRLNLPDHFFTYFSSLQ